MSALELACKIIATNLQLERADLQAQTKLVGNFPEFNSLTIAGIIESIEDELDCVIDDNEINTDIFATVGDLADFIERKSA